MLLKPKKTKYAKAQKGRISYTYRSSNIDPKVYSIIALEPARITASHIYASELAMKRKIRMGGVKSKNALNIRIFPHIPVTKKPIEVRMGKGKGKVDHWMTRIKTGSLLFTLNLTNPLLVESVWRLADSKLPIKTILIPPRDL